jgi:hypothetical protein
MVDQNATWVVYHYGSMIRPSISGSFTTDYIYREKDIDSQYAVARGEELPGINFKLR